MNKGTEEQLEEAKKSMNGHQSEAKEYVPKAIAKLGTKLKRTSGKTQPGSVGPKEPLGEQVMEKGRAPWTRKRD